MIAPFLGPSVLEVGAGIGGSVKPLMSVAPKIERLLLLEPDLRLYEALSQQIRTLSDSRVHAYAGTLADWLYQSTQPDNVSASSENASFDTVVYIDVLEHIYDDSDELRRAYHAIRPGGRIIVLAPAHQFLFSPFDRAIGHYRRYSRTTLSKLVPEGMVLENCRYLDSLGLLLTLINKFVLSSESPTRTQIRFWDSCVVPLSRIIDSFLGYRLGKSVLMSCRKAASA